MTNAVRVFIMGLDCGRLHSSGELDSSRAVGQTQLTSNLQHQGMVLQMDKKEGILSSSFYSLSSN